MKSIGDNFATSHNRIGEKTEIQEKKLWFYEKLSIANNCRRYGVGRWYFFLLLFTSVLYGFHLVSFL